MRSPVLFLVFNRPDTTRRVFASIREARPPRLYIAADGPRPGRGEEQRCAEVRQIASAVDWPCEVHTLFRDKNLGCKVGVANGVTWFFEQESEGIILEDDVLPQPTFFEFCEELLERYRDDARVAMITGCNFIANRYAAKNSYFFSRFNHIWGWASWRRAWQQYDVAMTQWPAWRDAGGLVQMQGGSLFAGYWRPILDSVYQGNIDTWDYQWTFACWRTGGLTIQPAVNQTHNLGFGSDATHTTFDAPAFVTASPPRPMTFPLQHPAEVRRDLAADKIIDSTIFGINFLTQLKRRLGWLRKARDALFRWRTNVKNAAR